MISLTQLQNWSTTHKKQITFVALFLLLATFLRFYNLDHTARFTQDESSDVLRMSRYWKERKITLVGPISNDQSKVFSSLTYYMVMPFAAAENFRPIGPVYGTAFWGVLTSLVFLLIARETRTNHWLVAMVLALAWGPLLVTSRWAWNPHFVPFWVALSVLAYWYKKTPARFFVIGLTAALAFHHHYLSIFATAPFAGLVARQSVRKKDWKNAVLLGVGYVLPFVPFFVFDLRHPPGLFFTRYLTAGETPNIERSLSLVEYGEHAVRNFTVIFRNLASNVSWLTIPVAAITGALAVTDWGRKKEYLFWLIPVLTLGVGCVVVDFFFDRYIYAVLPFFFVWLLLKRNGTAAVLQWALATLLVLGSLINLRTELTETRVVPDMYSLTKVDEILREVITTQNPKNPNIAVLGSKDTDLAGMKYRDLLSMYGVQLRLPNEVDASENMFIISTADEERVRNDAAQPMQLFGEGPLKEVYTIPDSDWKVYWFHY